MLVPLPVIRLVDSKSGFDKRSFLTTKLAQFMQKTANRRGNVFIMSRGLSKILFVMKLTVVLLTVTLLHVHAAGVSQKVSYTGSSVLLEKVFSELKKQTGYVFFYDLELIKKAKPVSIQGKDVPLQSFLKELLADQPLSFFVKKRSVFIRKKVEPVAGNPAAAAAEEAFLPPVRIKGWVSDKEGGPLKGVSVAVKGGKQGTQTATDGSFELNNVPSGSTLEFSFVGCIL